MDNRSSVINELPNHNMNNNQFGNIQHNDMQMQQMQQQQMQQQQIQQQQNNQQGMAGNYLTQDNEMVKDIINEINETDNLNNNNVQENFTNNKKDKEEKSFMTKLKKQLLPFFGFIIIFVLLSLSQTRSIFKKLPKGMNKSNQISMIGLLYQGFIGGILYFTLNKFV